MTERSKERTYTDAEIEARLKTELPHWYLENGWIRRKYRTNSWKGTLMVINTVGHLRKRYGITPISRRPTHGSKCACKIMQPRA